MACGGRETSAMGLARCSKTSSKGKHRLIVKALFCFARARILLYLTKSVNLFK